MKSLVQIYRGGLLMGAMVAVMGSVILGHCGSAIAAVEVGSQPKIWPAAPERHQVSVSRQAADDRQAAMIATAEAAQPSKEVLQKAAGAGGVPAGDKVWWYQEALGVRVACAITADAIAYYSELVGKFARQEFKGYTPPSSRLKYVATIVSHKQFTNQGQSFEDVWVVTMKLHFSQNFCTTQTEGMAIDKERVVVLDAAGKVLQIFGDGATEVPILAI